MSTHTNHQPIETQKTAEEIKQQKQLTAGLIIAGILLLAIIVYIIYFLLQDGEQTMLIRDIMIVLMAFEMLLLGISAVLLVIQITRLVNLIQNEIKPLLESANETIYTLRGTAAFISDSFVEPVIKFNGYIAAVKRALDLLNFNNQ
jgi:hypothetical protein